MTFPWSRLRRGEHKADLIRFAWRRN